MTRICRFFDDKSNDGNERENLTTFIKYFESSIRQQAIKPVSQ